MLGSLSNATQMFLWEGGWLVWVWVFDLVGSRCGSPPGETLFLECLFGFLFREMEFTQDFVRVLHMTEVLVHLCCPQSRGVCSSVGQTIGCVVGDLGSILAPSNKT